ncbi:MAG: tetratricopeptide repeat protein [Armatimonadetes bacterium]|nr:tetratricopeptide repeat protein [Armatimonadota bacterium]MBS1725768.1 tetratricopeptide repeat protein [Armatimonadota bacterium]
MSEEQRSLIQRATDLVNSGKFSEALELSRSVLVTDPNSADAKLIEAISLSQLGNVSDATEAFSVAAALAPTDTRVRYNAAVHALNAKQFDLARSYAQEVLSMDPSHSGAQNVLSQLPAAPDFSTPTAAYPREPMEGFQPAYEGIAFLRNKAPQWTAIGWGISALTFVFFIYFWATLFPHINELMKAAQENNPDATRDFAMKVSNPVLSFGPYILVFANIIYMIMDIIHRKGSFLWLIGHIPCSCCGMFLGGNFLTLPLYMALGRK